MVSYLRGLFGRTTHSSDLEPDGVLSVVGDVHGCARQLAALLPGLPGRIVLVGDLIDRGPESAQVLAMLQARPEIICLLGNHEEMLLDFLADPLPRGASWLRHGGLQTLQSYGIAVAGATPDLAVLRDELAEAMGDALIAWLGDRPRFWRSGNVAVTHAGADPHSPLQAQSTALVWGHPDCGKVARRDGLWIVHGHVIVPEPDIRAGVIRVDTGAYGGRPLTAAILGDGPLRFETAV